MRVFSRTRWWCTAAVISSDGIGARFSSQSRSESTMIRAPAAIALQTLVRSSSIACAQRRAAAVDVEVAGDPDGGEAGQVAVVVDVQDLGQLVVVDDRERQVHLPAGRRGGLQQVLLRAEGATQAGDQLLADGVQRRVGHLREQLPEVVVEQPRAVGQGGDRGVGAHRADRLGAGRGHRRHQDAQLLLGVAEEHLPADDGLVAGPGAPPLGQLRQVHEAGVQPVVVGVLGGEGALDLLVGDDPPGGGVDEEHPARLQPALGDDVGGGDVEDADLAGEDDQVVLGVPPAARAQPVAVEDGADERAVGEGDRGRPVPRLHDRGVEPVEGPAGRVHLVVVLPRLRDHHQHRVRQRAAGQVQQLEHLVEGGRVAEVAGGHREDPVQAELGRRPGGAVEQLGLELRLAGPHPVPVALDGVDLAVVRDQPERVGQRPARERVGREPAVHQRDRRLVALVAQVGEEQRQLVGGQHALVGDRAGRQRGDVQRAAGVDGGPLGPLAQHEGAPLQPGDAVADDVPAEGARVGAGAHRLGDEQLGEVRHDRAGGGADVGAVGVDRHVAPAEDGQALLVGELGDVVVAGGPLVLVRGQERDPDGSTPPAAAGRSRRWPAAARPGPGSGCPRRRRSWARSRRRRGGRGCAARSGPRRRSSRRPAAAGVGHEGDAARVLVVRRVVEARGSGSGGERDCGGGGEVGHVTPVVGGVRVPRGRGRGWARAGGRRCWQVRACGEPVGRGPVVPTRWGLAGPVGGVRWAVVRGATLARFRRGGPGQDRRRCPSEGYTAPRPPHTFDDEPSHARQLADQRRVTPLGPGGDHPHWPPAPRARRPRPPPFRRPRERRPPPSPRRPSALRAR